MTYLTISKIAADPALTLRVTACAAQEGEPDPSGWAFTHRYNWAASPGWDAAWESALAAHDADPGSNEAVITDGMILSAVQALRHAGG